MNFYFAPVNMTPLPGPLISYSASTESKSWAVFGDTNYKFDRLTVGAGARYFSDDARAITTGVQSGNFHSVDPRFYAQYKLNDQANAYASAAKGFRSGGFNGAGIPNYLPENVWTYELGVKMSTLDRTLNVDMSAFYSNYQNYITIGQPRTVTNAISFLTNAGAAEVEGVEWDVTWQLGEQLTLGVSGDYLIVDKYTKIETLAGTSPVNPGDPISFDLKYQVGASAQRNFQWNDRKGYVRLDYSRQGPSSWILRNVGPWYGSSSDVINMLNFHASLNWSENLRLGIFAQNLLNDRAAAYLRDRIQREI
jgi:outer membrane receptor protein involved in Fe transport